VKQPSLPNVPFLTGIPNPPKVKVVKVSKTTGTDVDETLIKIIIEHLWDAGKDTHDIAKHISWRPEFAAIAGQWTEAPVARYVGEYVARKRHLNMT